jgi:hypothetical protein
MTSFSVYMCVCGEKR